MSQNQQLSNLGVNITVNTAANTILFGNQIAVGNSTVNAIINSTAITSALTTPNTNVTYTWGAVQSFSANVNVAGALRLTAVPFHENVTNVAANYTLSTGYNAFSAGPITINDGITVTIPSSLKNPITPTPSTYPILSTFNPSQFNQHWPDTILIQYPPGTVKFTLFVPGDNSQ